MTPEYENLLNAINTVAKQNFPDSETTPENVELELTGEFTLDNKQYEVTFNYDNETGEFKTDGKVNPISDTDPEEVEEVKAETKTETTDLKPKAEGEEIAKKDKAMDTAVSEVETEKAIEPTTDLAARIDGVEKTLSEMKTILENLVKAEADEVEADKVETKKATPDEMEKTESVKTNEAQPKAEKKEVTTPESTKAILNAWGDDDNF